MLDRGHLIANTVNVKLCDANRKNEAKNRPVSMSKKAGNGLY